MHAPFSYSVNGILPRTLALVLLCVLLLEATTTSLALQRVHDYEVPGQLLVSRLYRQQQQQTSGDSNYRRRRPLILLPGMAQTIATWDSQATLLSRERTVLVCEPLGIGNKISFLSASGSSSRNVTLPFQAQCLYETVQHVFAAQQDDQEEQEQGFDIVGFSLGGRIAMAFACLYPMEVHNLHITGVAWERSARGKTNLLAWKNCLEHDNLRGFAWLAIMATYSPTFLLVQPQEKISTWVETLSTSHTSQGLLELMRQTHQEDNDGDDDDDLDNIWTVPKMANRLGSTANKVSPCRGHLCVGQEDEMAPFEQVNRLAREMGWGDVTIISNAGHAVPFESPRSWRKSVLQHCTAASTTN